MRTLVVSVPGDYVPTARVRWGGGTPRKTVEYQSTIAKAARHAMREQGWPEKHAGPLRVTLALFGDDLDCDGDNVEKGALDALKKALALKDDRLRTVRGCSWVYAGPRVPGAPGLVITIEELATGAGGGCT